MSTEARLLAMFREPSPEAFAPSFLAQVPFTRVKKVLDEVKRWGEAYAVRPQGEPGLWELETAQGIYPFLATLDGESRVDRLLVPPAPSPAWTLRLAAWTPWLLLTGVPGAVANAWRAPTVWEWLVSVPTEAAFVAFLLLLYVWPQIWTRLRPVAAAAFLLLVASAARLPGLREGAFPGAGTLLGPVLACPAFVWLSIQALLGRRVPPNAVALGPVLRGGTFVAAQAGSTKIVNYHVAHRHMRYAVDYLGVGRNGRHAKGLMPADPHRYAIFGATVLAPLDGTVEAVRSDLPDLSPPKRDPLRAAGNFVVLRAEAPDGREVRIVMAHLRQESVRVQVGETVRAGEPLGEVGNSGNTTEPHLHLGVTVGGTPGEPLSGEGVAFTVEGRFPVRGGIVDGGKR